MRSSLPSLALAALALGVSAQEILTDINVISQYWGELSPYRENAENQFGVQVAGLPDGCQVEQAHLLQRHAQRFPTSGTDGDVLDALVAHLSTFQQSHPSALFTGPLAFLNSWEYLLGRSYLTGIGAATELMAGATFWNRYGRILYNATAGQLAYNASYSNGTARPKPVLRTTGQSRIENSQINWALGFFGSSFTKTANPEFVNVTEAFNVVIIPEGGTENNTLASYDSCFNDYNDDVGYEGDDDLLFRYRPIYLNNATARLQKYAPSGFTFTYNDTYAMQMACAYESEYLGLGSSQFCPFFTLDEWDGFEQTRDIEYYYDYSFGNPTGRAQGIGYLQELLARLRNEYIFTSNSSVNSTITNNPDDFPLGRPFYADFSHDDIIVSVLTAMSVDYFHAPPSLSQVPPAKNRPFTLSKMTPFGGRLVTEVIGCTSSFPPSLPLEASNRTQYYSGQYGYNAANATHKFIRVRLNNGIVPLATIPNKMCVNSRPDAMCEMGNFLASQANAYELSNYNYACFGNYTIADPTNGADYNGAVHV